MPKRENKPDPESAPSDVAHDDTALTPPDPNIPPGTSFDTEEGRLAQGRDPEFRHRRETQHHDDDEHEREQRRERQERSEND